MSPRDRVVSGLRRVLEELYLGSASDRAKQRYTESSEAERRMILGAFLRKQLDGSQAAKQWVRLLRDRLSAQLE
jgi:hypothetical protein